MIKPIIRTIPTLSGNVKLACTLLDYNKIDKDTFETNIRGAHIYPLSSQLFQKSVEANLLNSSWEYDIKRFYSAYSDTFFDSCFNITKSEMPLLDKTSTLYPRNTDFEYGVKRVSYSKSGCQYACFAPIYIDNVNDIPSAFNIKLKIYNSARTTYITKTIRVNIGNNGSSDYNYIYKYLHKYLSKIDNNVAFMDNDRLSVIYYGIDLLNGGFTKYEDSTVSTLFNTKLPIQLFDYTLSEGFKRNNICMRQCLPLCFYFNIDSILTSVEKNRYAYGDIEFSGVYIDKNGNELKWHDFSVDYDNFSQDILTLNTANGIMNKSKGYIDNIMDVAFPSLNDRWISNYLFANKLSKTFNRWKLKYSPDNDPYITNMSWPFSKNQNNNYKYKSFPSNYTNQSAYAEIDSNNRYNLVFPLGGSISFYEKLNPLSISKYQAIMNNYCLTWFDVVNTNNFADFKDTINWADTDNGYTYYNGILYNLNYVYDRIPTNEKKIDKFAFLVYPDVSGIQSESYFKTDIKYATNILTLDSSDTANAYIYQDFISTPSRQDLYNFANYYGNVYTKTNLTFNGMLKPIEGTPDFNSDTKYYISSNDIVYVENNTVKTKNYYDVNTVYRADLLDKIPVLFDIYTWVNLDYSVKSVSKIIETLNTFLGQNVIDYNNDTINNCISIIANNIRTKLISNISYRIPELFDIDSIGNNLVEILPAYKASMYYNTEISNNDIKFLINDTYGKFKPIAKPIKDINIENNSLYSTYGVQLCKEGRFISKTWLIESIDKLNPELFSADNSTINYEELFNTFKTEIYIPIIDKCLEIINAINPNSSNIYIGHLYYPVLSYDDRTIGTNVAISKQNHFDTSIEDKCYTENIDDNVLYIHPFNIDAIANYITNNGKALGLCNQITVDDILHINDDNTITLKNTYNVLNILIYNLTTLTYNDVYCNWQETFTGLKQNMLPNTTLFENSLITPVIDELEEFTSELYDHGENSNIRVIDKLSDITKALPDVVNLVNTFFKNEFKKQLLFKQMRGIINNVDVLNMFLQLNNSVYLTYTGNSQNKKITQSFYKQYKVIDSKGDIKFKLDELTDFDGIKFNKDFHMFYHIDNTDRLFNIVVETEFVKINEVLFDFLNLDSYQDEFNDLYIYRPLSNIEYDDKFINTKIEYVSELDDNEMLVDTAVLYPCFDSLFVEERNETLIYKTWVLNNISPVDHYKPINITQDTNNGTYNVTFTKKDTFYRYNVDNTALMINITSTPSSVISKIPVYTEEFTNNTTGYITNPNSPFSNFNLIVNEENGITYGYYLLQIKMDNSRNMFNIKGILDSGVLLSNSTTDYIPQIKYINYINGVDISKNQLYITDIFKQLCPFLRINLLETAADNNTIMLPKVFNLHDVYITKTNNTIGAKEQSLVFTEQHNNGVNITQLQRYTNSIIPYLYEVNNDFKVYNYKYKNIQKMLLDTGKFASIGDIVYDYTVSNIDTIVPINVYGISTSNDKKDYNNVIDKYIPFEYKYFNNSKCYNLEPQIRIEVKDKLTYEQLLEYQSDIKTFNAFAKYLSKYKITDETVLLFLYKKYNKLYDTNPVGVFANGKTKAYKLTYIFNLL